MQELFQYVIDILRLKRYSLLKSFIFSLQKSYKPVILTRTACLGNETLQEIDISSYLQANHQKNRVDYILKTDKDPSKKAKANKIIKHIGNDSIRLQLENIYHDEERNLFNYKNVKVLIMDSFAELTDQLFVSKADGFSFCSHYTDIKHSPEFEKRFECYGLLDTKELKDLYDEFFKKIRRVYGNIPIIYLCFSAKFDSREKFQDRAKDVSEAILNRPGVNVIYLEDPQKSELDEYPYHYSKHTYRECAEKIVEILNENGIRVRLKRN